MKCRMHHFLPYLYLTFCVIYCTALLVIFATGLCTVVSLFLYLRNPLYYLSIPDVMRMVRYFTALPALFLGLIDFNSGLTAYDGFGRGDRLAGQSFAVTNFYASNASTTGFSFRRVGTIDLAEGYIPCQVRFI